MPELPDVEGFRRQLAEHLPGQRVRDVDVIDPGILRNSTPSAFRRAMVGVRFDQPQRHGKWLLLTTDGPTLLVHSGMTGHPYFAFSADEFERFDRLVLALDRGQFRYADLRKLRGIWLVHSEREFDTVLGAIGPDALGISEAEFTAILRVRRGRLKTVLTDQTVLAGLGNMLADEICWQVRINPARTVSSLTPQDLHRLYTTMRRVLQTSVRHGQVPHLAGWLSRVRDDPDAVCPRCGTALRRSKMNGRTAVWCPHCQAA